jgi:hypothetical protein
MAYYVHQAAMLLIFSLGWPGMVVVRDVARNSLRCGLIDAACFILLLCALFEDF